MRWLQLVLGLLVCASPAWATTRYISPSGAGIQDGSSEGNAYAFANGAGFTTALAASSAGDTIEFVPGDYSKTSGTMTIDKSGTAGNPIIIQGQGVASTNRNDLFHFKRFQYPTITGTRDLPQEGSESGNASTGINAFTFANGVDYITIRRFSLKRFQYPFDARLYENNNITISDIYMEDVRIGFYVIAASTCNGLDSGIASYTCPAGASDAWDIDRVYGVGVSKRMIRFDGTSNSTVDDVYASAADINGQIIIGDFPLMFWNDGAAHDNTFTDCECHYPIESESTSFDNGDCFGAEQKVTDITCIRCLAFDAGDGGFDMKGTGHVIQDSVAFRNGHTGYKIWGNATISNSIAGYPKQGLYSQYATGETGKCLQVIGKLTADNLTCINDLDEPYNFQDSINTVLTYNTGTGAAPADAMFITGATSGAGARVAYFSGTAVSGSLYVFGITSPATFTNGEIITGDNGFSATATNTGSVTDKCGELTTTDSVVAADRSHSGVFTTLTSDSCDTGSPTHSSTNDALWIETVSGTDPQYPNIENRFWNGDNNDFDSALYGATKGYYRNGTVDSTYSISLSGGTLE